VADIDFKGLADALLRDAEGLLTQWFPNGVQSGHEFKIGSVEGEAGDSLSVNVTTGRWADFAGDDKGGDLISLYAAKRGLTQLEAARELSGQAATRLAVPPTRPKAARAAPKWTPVLPVPDDAPEPPDRFARNEGTTKAPRWVDGEFVRRWTYHDADGRVLGHVARFHWSCTDPDTGEILTEKDVVPQTWCVDGNGRHAWRTRSFPVPRPLYGLRELAERPEAPVLVVEGEKSADAARQIARQYVVICWPGGIEAWRKAALNPLRGRNVLLWPDADEPGIKGMWEVAHALFAMCPTVKIILPEGKPDGWDAADALADGWGWRQFKEWALPLVKVVTEGETNGRVQRPGGDRPAGQDRAADAAGGAAGGAAAHAEAQPVGEVPGVPAGAGAADSGDAAGGDGGESRVAEPRPADPGPAEGPGAEQPGVRSPAEHAARADREPAAPAGLPAPAAAAEPQSQVARWLAWGLDKSGQGAPLANLNNAVAVFEHDQRLQGYVWFDEFLQRQLTGEPPREWMEADDANLALYMQRVIGLQKMGVDTVRQAARVVAYRNTRNCVQDWLRGLQPDGVERIERFFVDIFGAEDTVYTRAAGRNFWVSLVARAMNPGCQVDNMVVLEGAQGLLKSSALQVIGGEWYAAQHESPTNMRAFAEILQGKIIVEIEEMHSFSRADNEAIKKAITVRKDRFRPSGAHGYAKDHPRTCIFAGSTNRDDWNKDETGARRQWPIRCTQVDLQALQASRDLYFAEALAIYRRVPTDASAEQRVAAGAAWWVMPAEETRNEQQDRYDADPWMEKVAEYVEMLPSVTVSAIMQDALKIDVARFTRSDQMRVAACLTVLGWKQKNTRKGNRVLKVWKPTVVAATVATGGNAQVLDSSIPF
jgi:putative DNA primase/helicase